MKCPNCGADAQISPILGNVWCKAECDKKSKNITFENYDNFVINATDKNWLFLNPQEIEDFVTKTDNVFYLVGANLWELKEWDYYVGMSKCSGYVMIQLDTYDLNLFNTTLVNLVRTNPAVTYPIQQWVEYDKYPHLFVKFSS